MSLTQATSGLIANTGVTAGSYGSATQVPVLTINSAGQVTSAANIAISGGGTSTASANLVANVGSNNTVYITGNLVPTSNIQYDLGTPTVRFRSLYLSGNTIDLGGATIKTDASSGSIALIPTPTASNPNPSGIVIDSTGAVGTVATTGGVVTGNLSAAGATTSVVLKVTSIVYPGNETATDTAGGETITINGSGFQSGLSVIVGSVTAGVVTYVNSTQITFTAPTMVSGTYPIYIVNPDGGTAISVPGLSYSGTPTWSTAAGSLGSQYEYSTVNQTFTATGDAPISYTLASGTLPTGSTLSSNGVLSGTAPAESGATTFSFVIAAKDAQNQPTNRSFSLTINPDVVTWSSPTSGNSYSGYVGSSITPITLSASSAAGKSITYTANALPTGVTLSGNTISGTPTTTGTTNTLLTATANTTNKTATNLISWSVSVAGDAYFPYVSALLNAEPANTTTAITDLSSNSYSPSSVSGMNPSNFSPYLGDGYYSNYFDGSSFIKTNSSGGTLAALTFAGDFTIEFWINLASYVPSTTQFLGTSSSYQGSGSGWALGEYSKGLRFAAYGQSSNFDFYPGLTIPLSTWTHIAIVRSGSTIKGYVNGVAGGTTQSFSDTLSSTNALQIGTGFETSNAIDGAMTGYISNLRITKSAVYTTGFTPSTSPLPAISNTVFLSCLSYNYFDRSTNNIPITIGSTSGGSYQTLPKITSFVPFTPPSSTSTYGSVYFTGAGGLVFPDSTALQMGTGDFTLEFWSWDVPGGVSTWFSKGFYTTGGLTSQTGGSFYGGGWTAYYYVETNAPNENSQRPVYAWNHNAIVRIGTTITLYRNGVVVGTRTNDTSNLNNSSSLYIGKDASGHSVAGYMTDFRMVKGTGVYTGAFTPPTSPLTAISGTSLLTLQGSGRYSLYYNTFTDDGTLKTNQPTTYGIPTPTAFSPFSQTGWSTYFDGSSNIYYAANSNYVVPSSTDYTIEFWMFAKKGRAGITAPFSNYASSGGLIFELNTDGTFNFYYGTNTSAFSTTGAITEGKWNHIAIVRYGSGSNNVKVYINGVSAGSTTYTGIVGKSGSGFYLGSQGPYSVGEYFTGHISNFRFVNGTAVYTTAFTPPTTALTKITNTVLLTCQQYQFKDSSDTAATPSVTGNPWIKAFSPFEPSANYDPTIHGSSIYYDSGDLLLIADDPTSEVLGNDFTFECWAYPLVHGYLLSKRNTQDSNYGTFQVSINANGMTVLGVKTPGTSPWDLSVSGSSTRDVQLYTWHHIAFTRTGDVYRSFIDGVQVGTTTLSGVLNNSGYSWVLGSMYQNATGGKFSGYISDARLVNGTSLYSSAFTPPTAPLTVVPKTAWLINPSQGNFDKSGKNAVVTVGDVQISASQKKYGSYSYYFPGNTAYMKFTNAGNTVPDLKFGKNDFTIEMWIYVSTAPSPYADLYDTRPAGTSSSTGHIQLMLSGTTLYLFADSAPAISSGSGAIPATTWTHIALCRSGSSTKMFVNGTQVGSTYSDTTDYGCGADRPVIGIDANGLSQYPFNGYLDDIRITNGYARYTSNFTAPSSQLYLK